LSTNNFQAISFIRQLYHIRNSQIIPESDELQISCHGHKLYSGLNTRDTCCAHDFQAKRYNNK